ncbi:Rv3235 family protein [Kitasatospora sp. KL5]|uniref:Rv3235 family protein n=1 Tax=Kitasatospora sp. KL5 TaxID=3425125 RepID=UPI003D6EE317
MAEHCSTVPAAHTGSRAAAPLVRPLVHVPGRPQPRRPVRHAHPGRHAALPPGHPAAAGPRAPHRPRTGCAPSHGAGQGDLAARFAHRLVEVLTGVRPAGQLQRHTTLHGYQQLTALARTGPLRPRGRAPQTRLGRVYDSAPAPDALEVCVRVEFGPRHHMVAFRLERHRRTEQWQCAAVEAR